MSKVNFSDEFKRDAVAKELNLKIRDSASIKA
jgi:hypothetical protein